MDKKACILTIALMAISFSLSPDWYGWLMDSTIGDYLQWLLGILEVHAILNWTLAIFTVGLTILLFRRWNGDTDIRWYRPLVVLFSLQLLWVMNPTRTVLIVGWFDYRWLWTICLAALLFSQVDKWKRDLKKYLEESKWRGEDIKRREMFSLDRIDTESISKAKRKYGDAIVRHILGTELGKESFAVGITGAWGTGKSTFLEYIAKELKDKAEVVRFNPWMCRTPEQVAEDFFVTLHRELSPKYSTLSRPIRDYAKYISTATFSLGGGFLSRIALALPQESLMSRKRRLSERFLHLDKPVVVLIDDLDRLEHDEVFEVLRLIRNTADLSNVFYVVAYDKTYVTEALKEKKISDAETYLEKIFPIEVHQPKIEDTQLYKMLYSELSKQHEYGELFARKVMEKIDQEGREVVLDILNSYRRVLRFARVFLLNMDYIREAFKNEIRMIDMFWMELLQMYDRKTYEILAENRELLLLTAGMQYQLRKGIADKYITKGKETLAYNGEEFWKPLTPKILTRLFEDRKNLTKYSMRYAENYDKYFSLSVSEYRLSFTDFEELFDEGKDPLSTVESWIKGQKYFSSVIYQFENRETYKMTSRELGRYVMGLMEFGYQTMKWSERVIYQVKDLLRLKDYHVEQRGWGKGYMLGWFNEKIVRGGDPKLISKMLNRLFISKEVDENGSETMAGSLLITNDDIKGLLRDVMKKYLSQHTDLQATDVLNEKKELGEVFGNCSVCTLNNIHIDEETTYENVVFDMVTTHFESREKPTYRQFDKAMSRIFKVEMPDFISPMDYDEYLDRAQEGRDRELYSYFGREWSKVEEFKARCFVES